MEIKQQPLTEDLKKQIYAGFSRHAMAMNGHDEKFESVAFVAMDGQEMVGAIVVELFWGALHIKYIYAEDDFCPMEHGEWPSDPTSKKSFLSGYASIRRFVDNRSTKK